MPAANLIGTADDGLGLIERVTDEAIAAHASEAVGAMKVLLDTTVEYTKTRKQFGVPIGKFQVLQHRMVDMFMNYEQSASITLMVTLKLDESETERKKAASAAKVQIGKAGRFVGQQAVQLHGGMGMTDELNVGHYFKRLTMLDALYGNIDHHLKRYAVAGLAPGSSGITPAGRPSGAPRRRRLPGSCTLTRVPMPGALSSTTSPSWASAKPLTMASPSPVP